MKFQVVMLGVLFCLAADVAGQPNQGGPTSKPVSAAQQSLTGCIDEQFGQYVLLDGQMLRMARLQSAGPNQDVFAKYLGHKVQVNGARSSGPKGVFTVTGIEQIADNCAPAK
jgi:hypothetical protein